MSIVGKILVILNLIFALVVGGFLVVDFATRTNWAKEHSKLRTEVQNSDTHWRVHADTLAKLEATNKRLLQEREVARQEVADGQTVLRAQERSAKDKIDEYELRARDADLTAQKYLGEKERLSKENQGLVAILKLRDENIVRQQADIVKYRNAAVAQESAARALQDRLEQALARNAELVKSLATATTPGAVGDRPAPKGQANPPMVYVEAKIDSIHKEDSGLVQISAGSDKGLTKDHTLEAYRLDPPMYLGMIRIVDVQPHSAVGKLERAGTAARTPLRVGDTVSSTLSRN